MGPLTKFVGFLVVGLAVMAAAEGISVISRTLALRNNASRTCLASMPHN
jgi:hypothetical protein